MGNFTEKLSGSPLEFLFCCMSADLHQLGADVVVGELPFFLAVFLVNKTSQARVQVALEPLAPKTHPLGRRRAFCSFLLVGTREIWGIQYYTLYPK